MSEIVCIDHLVIPATLVLELVTCICVLYCCEACLSPQFEFGSYCHRSAHYEEWILIWRQYFPWLQLASVDVCCCCSVAQEFRRSQADWEVRVTGSTRSRTAETPTTGERVFSSSQVATCIACNTGSDRWVYSHHFHHHWIAAVCWMLHS